MCEIPQARNFWLNFSGTRIFWVDPEFSESIQNFLGSPNKFVKNIAKTLSQCKIGRVAAGMDWHSGYFYYCKVFALINRLKQTY